MFLVEGEFKSILIGLNGIDLIVCMGLGVAFGSSVIDDFLELLVVCIGSGDCLISLAPEF